MGLLVYRLVDLKKTIRNWIYENLKSKHNYEISLLGIRFFVVSFSYREENEVVFEGGPWFLKYFLIMIINETSGGRFCPRAEIS